jgi:hypothetical protein
MVLIKTFANEYIDISEVIHSSVKSDELEKLNLSLMLQGLYLDLYLSYENSYITVYIDDVSLDAEGEVSCIIDFFVSKENFINIADIITKRVHEWKLKNSN